MPAEGRKSVGLSWGSLAILFAAVALNFSFMTGGSFWSWFVREVKGYIQVRFQGFWAEFRELTGDIPVSCSGALEVCCRGGF